MKLTLWDDRYAIVRLMPETAAPEWLPKSGFASITRTRDETSIVCLDSSVPDGARAERGWRLFQLEGPIPFDQVGVLSSLVAPLAARNVSVFAVSTFDTDYLLVKEAQLASAIEVLESSGHSLR